MGKKLLLSILWFPLTFVLLAVNLTLLTSTLNKKALAQQEPATPIAQAQYAGFFQEGTGKVLGANVIAADSRALLLWSFLKKHDSPMAPYADLIVSKADEYGIDFRLVVAIAMCESNLGKKMPSSDSYNAWGIAVYTGQTSGAMFNDWPHAIEWVNKYIKEHYYDKGLVDLRDIGSVWAPPSVETGYSWTNCVEKFQGSIF